MLVEAIKASLLEAEQNSPVDEPSEPAAHASASRCSSVDSTGIPGATFCSKRDELTQTWAQDHFG